MRQYFKKNSNQIDLFELTAMICNALLWLLMFISFQVQAYWADCDGPFKGKTPTPTELQKVLSGGHKIVDLCGADLTKANLTGANLTGANLKFADLTGADLYNADLTKANLQWARLVDARLVITNLSMADLTGAQLTNANLSDTNLSGANLFVADLKEALFAPNADKLPNITAMTFAQNLDKIVTYHNSLPVLSKLREAFKNNGLRDAERTMTYLVRREQEKDDTPVERFLNHWFINWTCRYGLYPGHCLQIMFALVLLLSPVYLYALHRPEGGGLWAIWSPDRVNKAEGQTDPVRLSIDQSTPASSVPRHDPLAGLNPQPHVVTLSQSATPGWMERFRRFVTRWLQAWCMALYFSLLSAFHFGWRDLNVGNWIARIQLREYALRPTGWVRVVSGLQSLASVYLVALWVLSYFGRPFE